MPTIAEQFLTTEQAASALLDELESLKSETQHYGTASVALDAAGRSLSSLASEMTKLAARVRDLVLASREIGTERLLGAVEELTTQNTAHTEKLHSEFACVTATISSLEPKLDRAAASSERHFEGLESDAASLIRSVRLATWAAVAAFAASLAALLSVWIGRH